MTTGIIRQRNMTLYELFSIEYNPTEIRYHSWRSSVYIGGRLADEFFYFFKYLFIWLHWFLVVVCEISIFVVARENFS